MVQKGVFTYESKVYDMNECEYFFPEEHFEQECPTLPNDTYWTNVDTLLRFKNRRHLTLALVHQARSQSNIRENTNAILKKAVYFTQLLTPCSLEGHVFQI